MRLALLPRRRRTISTLAALVALGVLCGCSRQSTTSAPAANQATADHNAAAPAAPGANPETPAKPVPPPTPPDIGPSITVVTTQLGQNRYDEALLTAKDAARQAPEDYRAHYYLALANFGLERYDDAEAAAARALVLAPAEAKAAVTKLQTAIGTRRQAAAAMTEADAAATAGLAGKAARLYEQAWQADANRAEAGLKAADLYATTLGEPVAAGRILRRILATTPTAKDNAQAQLDKIASQLRTIADQNVTAASEEADYPAQMARLAKAEEADPEYDRLWLTKTALVAKGGTLDDMKAVFGTLARLKRLNFDALSEMPGMAHWVQEAEFAAFLPDLLGPTQIAEFKAKTLHPYQHALITVPEPDVTIAVDGQEVGKGGGTVELSTLPPGTHTLALHRAATGGKLTVNFTTARGLDDLAIAYSMDKLEAKTIPCPDCHGNGYTWGRETCPDCGGDGHFTCDKCGGERQVIDIAASVSSSMNGGQDVYKTCPKCNGKGTLKCNTCNGRGTVRSKQTCEKCGGGGMLSQLQIGL